MKQLLREVEASLLGNETEISPEIKLLIAQFNKSTHENKSTERKTFWIALDNLRQRIGLQSQTNVCFFLHLFEELLPSLEDDKLFLTWTTSFLKFAVNSAGVPLCVVKESRRIIMNLILPSKVTSTNNNLLKNSAAGVQLLVQVYLLKTELVVDFDSSSPQEYEERVRFIKKNCRDLLESLDLGKQVLEAISKEFLNPHFRFECFVLLSSLMSSSALLYQIMQTTLWNNMLLSILIDKSNCVVESGIKVLSMVLPHVCNVIADYLPTIMAILGRGMGGVEIDESTVPLDWKVLNDQDPENNGPALVSYKQLFTVLYGLFPLSLASFVRSPPTYVGSDKIIENLKLQLFETKVKLKCQHLLQFLKVHPNYFTYSSQEEELLDISRWDKMHSPNDIAAFCYQLEFHGLSKDTDFNIRIDELLECHRYLYLKDMKDAQKERAKTCQTSIVSLESSSESKSVLPYHKESIKESTHCKHVSFYLREILLAKNELDFTLHINQLLEAECELLKINLSEMVTIRDQNRFLADMNEVLRLQQSKASEQITRLLGEKERFQNDFNSLVTRILQQSNELKERELKLVETHQSNHAEIGDLNYRLEKLCNIIEPKELEVEQLKKKLRIASIPLSQDKLKYSSNTSTASLHQEGNTTNLKQEKSESSSRFLELKTEAMRLNAENQTLRAELEESKTQAIAEASRFKEAMMSVQNEESVKNKLKINDIVYNYEFKNQELQILIRELHNTIREKDMKLSQLTTTQPINIPRSSISVGKPASPGLNVMGDLANGTVGVYSRKPPTLNSASSSNSIAPFNKQKIATSKTQSKGSTEQIIKGRGGFQKRKLKM
ncbi:BA75_01039T0 [Komagataella pastoris]|uniref:BA75_01039T0 n=1 Tax=Komagataella pastoris TaxID=4922 RepID=A0A1B2J608_PICPA|nr:BA75_01039T0 [Komagataella pastoris]